MVFGHGVVCGQIERVGGDGGEEKEERTEQHAVALSDGLMPRMSVSNTFIFSTRQQSAVSVAPPTLSRTPLD